jgi:protein-tyrosine phosphatase
MEYTPMTEQYDDPTAYNLGGDPAHSDPRERRLNAWTNHGGGHRLAMPFMTQVADNLWHGGVERGLVLPSFVQYKLSLYRREDYVITHEVRESRTVEMYDHVEQGFDQIPELARWVNERRGLGPVFVHCQAGVNRSSLVVAAALIASGEATTGQQAIEFIRRKRDPACLCNPAFEAWVRDEAVAALSLASAA